jgi:hypothetical protein
VIADSYMTWDSLASGITAISSIVVAIGVCIGFYQVNRGAKNERYIQYIARYEEIITHLPYGIFEKGSDRLVISEEHERWLLAYIDLCSEELFDYLRGAIDETIWHDWQKSIENDFLRSKKHLKRVFDELDKDEYKALSTLIDGEKMPARFSAWQRFRQG